MRGGREGGLLRDDREGGLWGGWTVRDGRVDGL